MRSGQDYDYAVVGAGAAGCVVAGRLAETGARILLIEAGGPDSHPLIAIPGANVVTGTDPRLNWSYETEPVPALADRRLYWAQGRVMGGSASINGMMYLRGQPADFDAWGAGWSWADVLPAFRKSETNERGASDLHGGSGPIHVSRGTPTAPICDMFLDAAGAAGIPVSDDLNRPAPEAVGHVDQNVHRGRRSSPTRAYLAPHHGSRNLTVLTGTTVQKILFDGHRATGLRCLGPDGQTEIRVRGEIILSGGAVNSPALLLQSGIGAADELLALGIDVAVDLPGVGRNLQNHPCYKMMFTTTAPVTGYAHVRPLGAARAGLDYVLARRGPLARGLFPTAGLFRIGAGDHRAMQLCLAPALVIRRRPGVMGILPQQHGFTLLLNQGIPRSAGRVRLASGDPSVRPLIEPGYFSDPADMTDLVAAIRRTRDMVLSGPLAPIIGAEIQPAGNPQDEAGLRADIAASTTTHFHPVGTCRMGDGPDAVVDRDLRVHGVDGLRVVDASVMPRIVNGNTFAATVMIAERAAAFITGQSPDPGPATD